MKTLRVGAASLNQTPLDWDGNEANIRDAIRAARERGIGLLCLPELCVTGYGCEDAFFSSATRRMARRVVESILPETKGMAVCLGVPVMHRGALFNAVAFIVDGHVIGLVTKQHLAGDGLHYEPRWFKAWPAGGVSVFDWDGAEVPLGDLVFDLDGVRIGFEICEDAWVAHRPGAGLADRAVDVVLNPSASHFAFGKQAVRERLVIDSSRAFGVSYLYANLLGNEAGRAIYDGGCMIGSSGKMVARGERLRYARFTLIDAVIDIDAVRAQRAQLASRIPSPEVDRGVFSIEWAIPVVDLEPAAGAEQADWETADGHQEEEFTRAIALGLFDYMRKSRSAGFVVSLSGGADSTAVVCLVRLMMDLAIAELGLDAARDRLGLPISGPAAEGQLVRRILTTAYQGSPHSSQATRDAARSVATAIGAKHHELDIEGLNNHYTAMIEQAIGRPLDWGADDIALQNIQARVRAPGVWMLANLENKLLLATSNRSEAAVGYTTMDGDTCGGLSPIAGIDKAFLRRWLTWVEVTGPVGIGPIDAVGAVNRLTPTAELRPQDQNQTDEDDLMPYDILDAIEHEAIGLKRSPAEVLAVMLSQFPDVADRMPAWIERFFTLWSRNQWKRERFAPSFHVDDKNLDPKTWCRFPILSGGFRRELRELKAGLGGS
ncbi:MAG: NAD(+) synthase [Phycisphaerales bacterium JB063]